MTRAWLQWFAYHVWHGLVHVGLARYRYLCHYCAESDQHRFPFGFIRDGRRYPWPK